MLRITKYGTRKVENGVSWICENEMHFICVDIGVKVGNAYTG